MKKQLKINLPPSLHEALRDEARRYGSTLTGEIVRRLELSIYGDEVGRAVALALGRSTSPAELSVEEMA